MYIPAEQILPPIKEVTLKDLEEEVTTTIHSLLGNIQGRINFNGGTYLFDSNSRLAEIIKLPPGVRIIGSTDTRATAQAAAAAGPTVIVDITDGRVEGDIEFKNCVGKVRFLGSAVFSGRVLNGTMERV